MGRTALQHQWPRLWLLQFSAQLHMGLQRQSRRPWQLLCFGQHHMVSQLATSVAMQVVTVDLAPSLAVVTSEDQDVGLDTERRFMLFFFSEIVQLILWFSHA